jgi:hypothetical protein
MKVGFTGSRFGMTDAQQQEFLILMGKLGAVEFHHGDCIGADDQAATLTRGIELKEEGDDRIYEIAIVVHPPEDETHRASNPHWTTMMPPKRHFARNRDIVDETELLIATPNCQPLAMFGDMKYTVEYARKKGKDVYVIWPSGMVELWHSDKLPPEGKIPSTQRHANTTPKGQR